MAIAIDDGASALPADFEDLAPFLDWSALETQDARYLKRQQSPFDALVAFHAAMAPRLEQVFAALDEFAYGPLPPPQARLFRMALGLIEAAQAVEIFGQSAVPFATVPHSVTVREIRRAEA